MLYDDDSLGGKKGNDWWAGQDVIHEGGLSRMREEVEKRERSVTFTSVLENVICGKKAQRCCAV